MTVKYTNAFKEQAVEKVLGRPEGVTQKEIAESLGVDPTSLRKWIFKSRNHESAEVNHIKKEKRPQDWSLEERLTMVILCGPLDEAAMSEACRKQGLYPHHVAQWKLDFINGNSARDTTKNSPENRQLKTEVATLKKELNRKDKALAETAALLVLQKKVSLLLGDDGDNLR